MTQTIMQYSAFACAFMQINFALLHLSYKNKERLNYISATFFFIVGYLILYLWLFMTGIIFHVYWLLYSDLGL